MSVIQIIKLYYGETTKNSKTEVSVVIKNASYFINQRIYILESF